MNRRGFLGSVLGMVAGTPFLARLADEPVQRVVLSDWRMAFREEFGLLLQAPGVASVERTATGLKFVAETLNANHAMTIVGTELRDKNNKLVSVSDTVVRLHMINGDQFNCTYLLSASDAIIESMFRGKPQPC